MSDEVGRLRAILERKKLADQKEAEKQDELAKRQAAAQEKRQRTQAEIVPAFRRLHAAVDRLNQDIASGGLRLVVEDETAVYRHPTWKVHLQGGPWASVTISVTELGLVGLTREANRVTSPWSGKASEIADYTEEYFRSLLLDLLDVAIK